MVDQLLSRPVLLAVGVRPDVADKALEPLKASCALFSISTKPQVAAFLAQCMVESSRFETTKEDLYYTTPQRIRDMFPSTVPNLQVAASLARNPEALANRVYGSKNGNRGVSSGDGWRYRGRGFIQLTGRANYADAAEGLARPYLEQPDLVAEPSDAALTAAFFWHNNKLNLLADKLAIDMITRAVNGPRMVHKEERRSLFEKLMKL